MTNGSQLLAESLTNLVESRSENVIEFLDGNYCESQKYIEELNSESLKSSIAAVQVISKDTSGKLHSRESTIEYCKYKFPSFPKDKPLRRRTSIGGKSANDKLASYLIALVRYCCSGEMYTKIGDMFKKSSVSQETSFVCSHGQKSTNCSGMDQFMKLNESLHNKLCLLREDFEQSGKCLRN